MLRDFHFMANVTASIWSEAAEGSAVWCHTMAIIVLESTLVLVQTDSIQHKSKLHHCLEHVALGWHAAMRSHFKHRVSSLT